MHADGTGAAASARLPGFGSAMSAVKHRAGPRPICVLCVHLFCICVESCFLCRVPHCRRPGEAWSGIGGHGDVPHGAWGVSVAAAIAALCRMTDELVHGVLAQESSARWPSAGAPGASTVYGVLPPRFGPTRPWLAALPAWLWCMGFCRPGNGRASRPGRSHAVPGAEQRRALAGFPSQGKGERSLAEHAVRLPAWLPRGDRLVRVSGAAPGIPPVRGARRGDRHRA